MGKENYAMGDVIEFRPRQIELNASGIDSRVQELFPQDSPIFFKTYEAVAGYKGSKQWYEYPRFTLYGTEEDGVFNKHEVCSH